MIRIAGPIASVGAYSASPCMEATDVRREDGRREPVALHAERPEAIRIGGVGHERRRDDRVGMLLLHRPLERAIERRVRRRDDRV